MDLSAIRPPSFTYLLKLGRVYFKFGASDVTIFVWLRSNYVNTLFNLSNDAIHDSIGAGKVIELLPNR